jgi:hypothetical protein
MSAAAEARWAVWGKAPGSRDEHGVLAHSEGEGGDATLTAAIRRLPVGDTWAAAGGTRLLFTPENTGESRFGLAVVAAGDADGFGRGTALVRYVDVPLAAWIAADQPFSALFAAYSAGLPETPGRRAEVALHMPARPVSETRAEYPDIFTWCVALTGAVLDGPAVVTGADSLELGFRLAVLDTVAALLPAWAKGRLSAATWTDTTQHDLRLSFSDAAAPDAIRAPWMRPIDDRQTEDGDEPRLSPGTAYAQLLRSVADTSPIDEIVGRLAAMTTAPDRAHDLTDAFADLRGIAAIGAAVRDVSFSGDAVEWYPLGRWPADQRATVQSRLLETAGEHPGRIRRWWQAVWANNAGDAVQLGRDLARQTAGQVRGSESTRPADELWQAGADIDPAVAEAYANELLAILAEPDRRAGAVAWLHAMAEAGRLAELRGVLAGHDDLLRDFLLDELRQATPVRLADLREQLARTDPAWLRCWTAAEMPRGLGLEATALLWALARRTGPPDMLEVSARELVSAAIDAPAGGPVPSRWRLLQQELTIPLGPSVASATRGFTDAARVLLRLSLRDLPGDTQDLALYLDAYEQGRRRVLTPAGRGDLLSALAGALLESYPEKLPKSAVELLTGYAAGPGEDVRSLAELVIEHFPKHRGLPRKRLRGTDFWDRLHAAHRTDPHRRLLLDLGQAVEALVDAPGDPHGPDRLAELSVGARRKGWPARDVLAALDNLAAHLHPATIDDFLARHAARYGLGDPEAPAARDELDTVHQLIGGGVWGKPGERYRQYRLTTVQDRRDRHLAELANLKHRAQSIAALIAEYEATLTVDEAELALLDDGRRR